MPDFNFLSGLLMGVAAGDVGDLVAGLVSSLPTTGLVTASLVAGLVVLLLITLPFVFISTVVVSSILVSPGGRQL